MLSPFEIEAPFSDAEIRDVVRAAENEASSIGATPALVRASIAHLAVNYRDVHVLPYLTECIEMHEMVEGERADQDTPQAIAAWDSAVFDAIGGGMGDAADALGLDTLRGILGAMDSIKDALPDVAYKLAWALVHPHGPGVRTERQWLSSLGIVQQHVDALTPGKRATIDEATGAKAPRATPKPPEILSPAGAFQLFGKMYPRDGDAIERLATRLGVAPNTVRNWLSGKTTRIKITNVQAQVMISEIDVISADLMRASAIFRATPAD